VRTPSRLAAFAAAAGVTFGAAALAGGAIAPLRDADEPAGHGMAAGHGDAHGEAAGHGAGHGPAGLAVAEDGYALVPERTLLRAGERTEIAFRIVGPNGRAVRRFAVTHEKRMHLIVVRRDLAGFQHLHPRMDATGRWSVTTTLPEGGVYRAYADFRAGGEARTLATDLHVAGAYRPQPLPAPAHEDATAGYAVTLEAHGARAGATSALTYAVARDGAPVTDLEPYLGADGHLVALREGDLAFLHVHPEETAEPGRIRFAAEFPSAGRYRLFMQFRHHGSVRTVAHTLEVPR
jgi:hypothetical protein